MSLPFTRSLRSLDTERSPLSTLALIAGTVLLGLWSFWFFFVEVRIYEVTGGARLEVSRALHRIQSQVAARVEASHLVLGREVIAGDVLLELNAAPYRLELAEEEARRASWLEGETRRLREDLAAATNMVGDSDRMRQLFGFVGKVAPTDATVLIRGETGTGKELVARAIHANSPRAERPFVAINCAALTETLLESELFGHEKGAFTGAVSTKKGKLEVAEGGTVFLDEVGEMALGLQAKLLRVLQERELERVGGTVPIKIDIRLIAATNRDLEKEFKEGRFRQDLYYRLNVVSVTTPPLRERREDIPQLTDHFVRKHAGRFKKHVTGVSPAVRASLARYDWPGNVRELENAIERAVVMSSEERIRPEDLPEGLLDARPAGEESLTPFHDALRETKRKLILQAFREADGNVTEAARRLGIHRNYLYRMIGSLELKEELEG